MARRVRAYTEIGKRIAKLGGRQREIAEALQVSQQTVSKKLRGETAILLADIEALAKHYQIPLTYFFEEWDQQPDLARALEKVKNTPGSLQTLVVQLASMQEVSVRKTLAFTETLAGNR